MSDYIKRDALMDAIKHLDWYHPAGNGRLSQGAPDEQAAVYKAVDIYQAVNAAPSANVLEMPEGEAGDYLLWDNGVCQKIYGILCVFVCSDGVRYDLGDIAPFVNHPNIVKIMNREEAEKYLRREDNGE